MRLQLDVKGCLGIGEMVVVVEREVVAGRPSYSACAEFAPLARVTAFFSAEASEFSRFLGLWTFHAFRLANFSIKTTCQNTLAST
jgi:hypothetical protein